MRTADAEFIVAKLFAAFPGATQEMTAAVYVEAVTRLHDPDIALRAVNDLIDNEVRLPPVGLVREHYDRNRVPQPALPEPDLTPEQIAENVRRRNIIVEMLASKIDLDEALQRMNA